MNVTPTSLAAAMISSTPSWSTRRENAFVPMPTALTRSSESPSRR